MVDFIGNGWEIKNVKAVLLDKDGTFQDDNIYWGKLAEQRVLALIEHFKLSSALFEELCFAIGHNPKTCKLIKNGPVGVLSRNEVIDFMVKELFKYNVTTDFETVSKIFDDVHSEFMVNISKYVKFLPYAEEFIRNLKKLEIKLAVVTSDSYLHTKEILKILNIDDCIECVIGKDNCQKDKKSGEPALLALDLLKVKPEDAIVIGDAIMDFMMSKNSGLKGAILVSTGQTELNVLKECSNYIAEDLSKVIVK